MTPLEVILAAFALVAVVTAIVAVRMLADARQAEVDAQDAAATAIQDAERRMAAAADAAALAERTTRIVEAAWNRSVDALQKAQRPAPVTYGTAPTPRHLEAVRG